MLEIINLKIESQDKLTSKAFICLNRLKEL